MNKSAVRDGAKLSGGLAASDAPPGATGPAGAAPRAGTATSAEAARRDTPRDRQALMPQMSNGAILPSDRVNAGAYKRGSGSDFDNDRAPNQVRAYAGGSGGGRGGMSGGGSGNGGFWEGFARENELDRVANANVRNQALREQYGSRSQTAKFKSQGQREEKQSYGAGAPLTERRAILFVVPPYDTDDARVDVTLSPGLRLEGNDKEGAQTVWRGAARADKPIRIPLTLVATEPGSQAVTVTLNENARPIYDRGVGVNVGINAQR
jgi:hypothetical protein